MIEIVHHRAVHSLPVVLFRIKQFMSAERAHEELVPKLNGLLKGWINHQDELSPPDPLDFTLHPKHGVDVKECKAVLEQTFPMSEITMSSSIYTATEATWERGGYIDYTALGKAVEEFGEYRQKIRVTNATTQPGAPSLVRLTQLGDIQMVTVAKRVAVAKNPYCPVYLRIPPGRSVDVTAVWLPLDQRCELSNQVVKEIRMHGYDRVDIIEDIPSFAFRPAAFSH